MNPRACRMPSRPSETREWLDLYEILSPKNWFYWQRELREREVSAAAEDRDEATVEQLRQQFLQTTLSYCGVPYAQRYHDPDCE